MNATDIEPSAKRRLNRFGNKKATEKASDKALVPKKLAFVISLKSPRTLDINVRRDRADPLRTKEPVVWLGFTALVLFSYVEVFSGTELNFFVSLFMLFL